MNQFDDVDFSRLYGVPLGLVQRLRSTLQPRASDDDDLRGLMRAVLTAVWEYDIGRGAYDGYR